MPRRRRQAGATEAATAAAPVSIQPALALSADALYLPSQVIAALGLRASSLRTEWRRGRLRVIRRCGKNYLLGRDLLAWLDGGELTPPGRVHAHERTAATAGV